MTIAGKSAAEQQSDRGDASPIDRLVEWWSATRDRWARLAELRELPPDELRRVAGDVGLSAGDLLDVSNHPEGTQQLLERRLTALGLQPGEITELLPMLLRDLQRTCTICQAKAHCISDMKISPLADGWESYCPNSGTLRTLLPPDGR